DLSMIKFAGLGVAMGNGDDDVKAAAKYITDDNNRDGVAKAIEKFVLGV
ncbi:MAG: HAD hydrolase family protein, partial [Clostridium sp.]